MAPLAEGTKIDATEAERAQLFGLLARLLGAPPDAALLGRLAVLEPDGTLVGHAIGSLATAARAGRPDEIEREFFDLFIGVGRGELLPYASYYLTGFLHERPLARLRADLAQIGIRRLPGVADPEDHIAFLCEVMAGLVAGRYPGDADGFFATHLRPWAGRFVADLETASAARFYRAVGLLGRSVMDIEQAAAELAA